MRSTLTTIGTTIGVAMAAMLLATPISTSAASAQAVCGQRSEIVKKLRSDYEERRRSAGIAANGGLVEVFSSEKGSWTITFTKPGGPTCLIAVGDNWQKIDEPLNLTGEML